MLTVDALSVKYGPIEAVRSIAFHVEEGEIVTLLGANGAGKTSTLQALMGLVKPAGGTVRFRGRRIDGMPAERIVRTGLTLTPEGRRVFAGLTVRENLRLGGSCVGREEAETTLARMFERFPILAERRDQAAGTLSGGEQQMLAIARSLMAQPRLLMLDEPSLGLAPKVVDAVFDLVGELREEGLTILLVEQNVYQSLMIADRAYVLDNGTIGGGGPARLLLASEDIQAAYLGAA